MGPFNICVTILVIVTAVCDMPSHFGAVLKRNFNAARKREAVHVHCLSCSMPSSP